MKKLISVLIITTLLFVCVSTAFAKPNNNSSKNEEQNLSQQKRIKEKKQEFKIKKSPVIKYGKYKLPINPVTKGMGASVTFDQTKAILTVTRGSIIIVINFKEENVTINGVADTKTDLFKVKNSKKTTVLIKYIANTLGVRAEVDKEKVIIEVPGLDFPTNITVTPVGGTVVANTLNRTNLYLTASANIIAGQATGGRAELYIGSTLVATDTVIGVNDTIVTFTASDGSPTNEKLQALIPAGGRVSVKLYNANNQCVTTTVANPAFVVDYVVPTINGITSAIYNVAERKLYLVVSGAGAVGDKVDVTKLWLYDSNLGRYYRLTDATGTGSTGVVSSEDTLLINIGSTDFVGLHGFGNTTVFLTVGIGSLLTDAAGNTSTNFTISQTVPVLVIRQ